MKSTKKYYLRDLQAHDQRVCDSVVRLIEMVVDQITGTSPGYNIQFWKDVGLYGLDEASTYLKNAFPQGDFQGYDTAVAKVKESVDSGTIQ